MYTTQERDEYFNKTINFFKENNLFEGVLQIGSGTIGYHDEHSDIDLMAAYYNTDDVLKAKNALMEFLHSIDVDYIWERSWSKTVLGV